ncbi:hypothetical protein PMAYCL1PPCAC_11015, partial [Pristionchus mayeri]
RPEDYVGDTNILVPTSLLIYDFAQDILVISFLVITAPPALFTYCKLLFSASFTKNYTCKIIAVNGVIELFNCATYIIAIQLASYPFMSTFYKFVQSRNITTPLCAINIFLRGLSLYTALIVALDRLR